MEPQKTLAHKGRFSRSSGIKSETDAKHTGSILSKEEQNAREQMAAAARQMEVDADEVEEAARFLVLGLIRKPR